MMRKSISGYATLTSPTGQVREADTFTCAHCNSIRHVMPKGRGFIAYDPQTNARREHEYTRCGMCSELICEMCLGLGCMPFEKKLEAFEAAVVLYQKIKQGG